MLQTQGVRVRSLAGELQSHMPHGMAKRIIIKIIGEFVNNWKSNSTLLNNPLVKEKISKEIRKYRLEQK